MGKRGRDSPRTSPLAIGDLVDGFEIVGPLGAGGAGGVWLARVPENERRRIGASEVAIKTLHVERAVTRGARKRFEREATTGLGLSHPNLVGTHGWGYIHARDTRFAYLVMERVEGETLREILVREWPLGEELIREIGLQAARGLAAIHRAELIHRDIKPSNLMWSNRQVVKLLDLGVVLDEHAMGGKLTLPGTFLGTVSYAAPERLAEQLETPEADLYSLGVVMYELATGANPFLAESRYETVRRHMQLTPPPPSQFAPWLSSWFDGVLLRLLQKDPARRYPSADALAQVLARSQAGAARSFVAATARAEARPERALTAPPLTDRADQLVGLETLLRGAVEGTSAVVSVVGGGGCGRTRLVAELVERAARDHADLDIASGRALPADQLDELVMFERAGLAGDGAERMGSGPELLVLEDVDLLPESGRERLAATIVDRRRPRLVVLTARRMPSSLVHVIDESMVVSPLQERAALDLLGACGVAVPACARIVAAIQLPISPGWLLQIVQLLAERGDLGRRGGGSSAPARFGAIPATEDGLIRARLRQLTTDELAVLRAVALLGGRADFGLVAAMVARPAAAVARALSRLSGDRGHLVAAGGELRCADRRTARLVRGRGSAAARLSQHTAAAQAWERRVRGPLAGRAAVEVVRHRLAAGDPVDAPVLTAARGYLRDRGARSDLRRLSELVRSRGVAAAGRDGP